MTYLQYFIDALSLGGLYAVFALGVAMVFSIMRLINFAHGELIMIGALSLLVFEGLPTWLRILVSAVVVVIAALLMERIAFRPVRGARDETLMVTSFAVSFFIVSLTIVIRGSTPVSVGILPELSHQVSLGPLTVSVLDLVTIAVTTVCVVALSLFLKKTSLGIQMRAAAENFAMARSLGVPANRVISLAFAISGLLAFVGSVLLVSQTGLVSPTMGSGPVFTAFVATILGGMGSIAGAVVGGYLLGILTIAFQALLPISISSYRDALVFAVLVLVLAVRPGGIIQVASQKRRV